MRLRPATPLTVLLVAAFVLLLSVLSEPVTTLVPLAQINDIAYGVFGYCKAPDGCSPIGIGYEAGKNLNDQAFDLPSGVRISLTSILVFHPIAAGATLISCVMAGASHLHRPSHSSRYHLALFIVLVLTLILCLIAFLVDVLLFIPHMAWGSYLVLAASIMLALSAVCACIMRRTLTSRKAHRKRVAENAEMSGENFYNREAHSKTMVGVTTRSAMPMVSGGLSDSGNDLPAFATFDGQKKSDLGSDEHTLLTQRMMPSRSSYMNQNRTADGRVIPGDALSHAPAQFPNRHEPSAPGMSNAPYATRSPSAGRMRPGGARKAIPLGGFPGPDGGYMSRTRRSVAGPAVPPPGSYEYQGGQGPPPRYNNPPGPAAYPQQPPFGSDPRGPDPSRGEPLLPDSRRRAYDVSALDGDLPRAESPPPLPGDEFAQAADPAAEMHAAHAPPDHAAENMGGLYQADVGGMSMVRTGNPGRAPERRGMVMSDASRYSTDDVYVAPRAAWNPSPARASPARSPTRRHPEVSDRSLVRANPPQDNGFAEDVDPRFAGQAAPPIPFRGWPMEPDYQDAHAIVGGARSPAESERSNFTSISQRGVNPQWVPNHPPMPYQRGGGPRRPMHHPPNQHPHHHDPHHHRHRQQQQQQHQKQKRTDMLLNNPDFQLPGGPGNKDSRRRGSGMIPGSAYPAGPI